MPGTVLAPAFAPRCRAWLALVLISWAAAVSAGTGDGLCDAARSTADTCVITGSHSVDNGVDLTFLRPNVRVEGTIGVRFTGVCSNALAIPCSTDASCAENAPCLRTGDLTMIVDGRFAVGRRGRLEAIGQTLSGDRVGHDGGTITLTARDVAIEGILSTAAQGRPGVRAGNGGAIAINATSAVSVEETAILDASTTGGACGGEIVIGAAARPGTIDLLGELTVEGATTGGSVQLDAADRLTVSGELHGSNTNGDRARRASCGRPAGGGQLTGRADRVEILGSLRAIGRQAGGGGATFEAGRLLLVEFPGIGPAINVSGGDVDAFTFGGEIFFTATAGDVILRRGAIEAGGDSSGFGADAGSFQIGATAGRRCRDSGALCTTAADCATGEPCNDAGGNIIAAVSLSARGGSPNGFGCPDCRIAGDRAVDATGQIDVSGGAGIEGGGLGALTIAAGTDLDVGPGAITASGADGGDIVLLAGDPTGGTASPRGLLRVANGTQIRAEGLTLDGLGGTIELQGCDVTVEANTHLSVSGRGARAAGDLLVVARERLTVRPLSHFEALPDGVAELVYRQDATVAPDARFEPAVDLERATALAPCPSCGNTVREPPEQCDGRGTCAAPGLVCVLPGLPRQCSCIDTCGRVPGIQPGEQCDGTALGGRTCRTEGFRGGTLRCATDCTIDTTQCLAAVCGDGITDPGETCDVGGIDGAEPDFDDATCESEGFPAGGALTCKPDCTALITVPHCAVSVETACTVEADCPSGEACVNGCFQCGNGFLDPSEECDQGAGNSDVIPNACRTDCTLPSCGDGVVDDGEDCDDGPDSGPDRPCTDACRSATCGDGTTCSWESCTTGPSGGPEQCDDGDAEPDDGCGTVSGGGCALPACGNGSQEIGEECDDGNLVSDDGCDANCTTTRCGNGIVGRSEDCDPPTACCDLTCRRVVCDDGDPCTTDTCDPISGCIGQAAPGTTCDDGNACTTRDVCAATADCAGTVLSCEPTDPCQVRVGCDPGRGCLFRRRSGFDGLACLPYHDLQRRLEGLQVNPLRRTAARISTAIERASEAGPGRTALRRVRAARRGLKLVMADVTKLRRKGRISETVAQQLVNQATEIVAGLDAVVAELRR